MGFFLGITACFTAGSWSYNVATDSVQYIISDSHLDTQWNWDFSRQRYMNPGAAAAGQSYVLYAISGRRVGSIPCTQVTNSTARRGNLPLKSGVRIVY